MTEQMKQCLQKAIIQTIREMGLEEFKKTSFFLSNEKANNK